MPHRRIGLGAMPMSFTGVDMRDITHVDLALFVLRRNHARAGRYDQHWSQVWVCHPVVQPWLKLTALQL
jgi:hypothetical protein